MIKRKLFTPSTFTSTCWFCSLFATLFFSFVYLHPRQTINNNHITTLNINSLETKLVSSSNNKYVSDETVVAGANFPRKAALVNLTAPVVVVELSRNNTIVNENFFSNGTVLEIVEKTLPPTTTTTTSSGEEEEDYDIIPLFDVLSNPPWNCTREERITWLRNKLNESKILKSTIRTRNFEEKIQAFFRNQGNNTTTTTTAVTTGNNTDNNNDVKSCKVRIFFTWISPASLFGKRELLALESVLKTHPNGCVLILSRTMDSKPGRALLQPLMGRGYRILPIAPDFQYLFDKTPAQTWLDRLQSGEVDPGTVPITQNLSNLLRMALLYKYGGVYLDTDIILLKSVSGLKNSIGIQSIDDKTRIWRTLNNAVLIFDKGHPLVWEFMEEFASTFDGFKWGYNGPYLTTRVVSKFVNDDLFQFNLMSPMAFYPIDWIRIPRLFEKPYKNGTTWATTKFDEINAESYGIHLWNKQTRGLKIEKSSAMGQLISEHCIICNDVYDS